MKTAWMALPALVLLTSCAELNPARMYQEAARKLNFSLDRVEPSIQLAFPLEESRLGLRLMLGVDNPTSVRFRALGLAGRIHLDEGAQSHPIGQVGLGRGLDLVPNGRSQMSLELTFSYRELTQSWGPLNAAIRGRKGTWRVEGHLQIDAFGIPVTLPLKVVRTVGS